VEGSAAFPSHHKSLEKPILRDQKAVSLHVTFIRMLLLESQELPAGEAPRSEIYEGRGNSVFY
jgi:hypothetical protein